MPEPQLLCTEGDVKSVLGRDLTSSEVARWKFIARKATALVRDASGQQFHPGCSVNELRVVDHDVYLEQRPLVTVHAVTDLDGRPVTYRRKRGQWLHVDQRDGRVVVDYSHGSDVIPETATVLVADIVAKVLSIDPNAAAGRVQYSRTAGPYTEMATYATWAQGGQTNLSPLDLQIAQGLGFRPPRTHVMRAL